MTKIGKLKELIHTRTSLIDFMESNKWKTRHQDKKKINEELDRLNYLIKFLEQIPMGRALTIYEQKTIEIESKINFK